MNFFDAILQAMKRLGTPCVGVIGDEHAEHLVKALVDASLSQLRPVPLALRPGWGTQTFVADWGSTTGAEVLAAARLARPSLVLVVLGSHDTIDAPFRELAGLVELCATEASLVWIGPPRISRTFQARVAAVREAQQRALSTTTPWLDGFELTRGLLSSDGRMLTQWGYRKWAEQILRALNYGNPVLEGLLASVGG